MYTRVANEMIPFSCWGNDDSVLITSDTLSVDHLDCY